MALLPSLVFDEAVVEEDLKEGVKLRVFGRNNGVQAEKCIKVEDRREAQGGCYDVESSSLRRGWRKGTDIGKLVLV
jgi:hypothetical protein